MDVSGRAAWALFLCSALCILLGEGYLVGRTTNETLVGGTAFHLFKYLCKSALDPLTMLSYFSCQLACLVLSDVLLHFCVALFRSWPKKIFFLLFSLNNGQFWAICAQRLDDLQGRQRERSSGRQRNFQLDLVRRGWQLNRNCCCWYAPNLLKFKCIILLFWGCGFFCCCFGLFSVGTGIRGVLKIKLLLFLFVLCRN